MCPLPHWLCLTLPDNLVRPTLVAGGAAAVPRAGGGDKEMDGGAGGGTLFQKVSTEALNDGAGKLEHIRVCGSGLNGRFTVSSSHCGAGDKT